jgi:DNA polymerase-1
LATAAGQPTWAVLGVLNMLYKLLDELEPERMAVVFDAPGKTFRAAIYSEYKANRPPMPDELRAQVEPLFEAIRLMGLCLLRVEGVEADDVIGTLAKQATAAGCATVISTGDKDLAQLVDAHVTLVNTMDNTTLDRAGVEQKFGVTPEQIADYLALVGDPIDNIPGIAGVGPKTAVKWLQQFHDLETLKARAGEVGGKIGDRLREALGTLALSKDLATIRCDVELPVTFADLARRPPDVERLGALFERLEFTRLLRRVRAGSDAAARPDAGHAAASEQALAPPAGRYETVVTPEALERWCARIAAAPLVALATATTTLAYRRAELVGISLAVTPGEAAYIPLAHRYPGAPDQLDRETVVARLKPWLESAAPKAGHQLKFDAHVFASLGVALRGLEYDTMLESYVLNSTATRHERRSVAAFYLGLTTRNYEDVVGKGSKQITFDQVDLEAATHYSAEEADIALRLHETLWPRLAAAPGLTRVYA